MKPRLELANITFDKCPTQYAGHAIKLGQEYEPASYEGVMFIRCGFSASVIVGEIETYCSKFYRSLVLGAHSSGDDPALLLREACTPMAHARPLSGLSGALLLLTLS